MSTHRLSRPMFAGGRVFKLIEFFKTSQIRQIHAHIPRQRLSRWSQPYLRTFGTTIAAQAGHNKWSKTKHIKAVTDKRKMAERTRATYKITLYSSLFGDDVQFNPQLASAIVAATKASVPKALIEGAIARGQGRSASGAQLESITLEVLIPPDIAIIIDVETDNKNRALHDLKQTVKKNGARVGSTNFYFSRRGRAVFQSTLQDDETKRLTLSDVLEAAIEIEGAEDVEAPTEDGRFLVWTQPAALVAVTEALSRDLRLEILESDIVWDAKEDTLAHIDSEETTDAVATLLAELKEYPDVKAVFANVRKGEMSDDHWERIERNLDN